MTDNGQGLGSGEGFGFGGVLYEFVVDSFAVGVATAGGELEEGATLVRDIRKWEMDATNPW